MGLQFGLNLMTIALFLGVILLIMSFMKAYKSKELRNRWTTVGVLLLGVFALGAFANVSFLSNDLGGGSSLAVSPTITTKPGGSILCAIEDTTVTLSGQDAYTSASSGGTHRYRIGGEPALTVSDAGTFTASPGDVLEVLWYNASTSGGYFSDVSTVTIACKGTETFSKTLYNNGTVTIQVFNEEGNVIDGGATENETLGAGDVVSLKAEIRGQYQRGMPYGGLLIVEYNTTEIDDVIVDFGDTTVIPVSAQFYTISATSHGVKAYRVPPVLSNQLLPGTITIDADDTIDPSVVDDIDLTLRQYNHFINNDKGGAFELGVEDEDNVATQPANVITATLHTD